MLAAIDVSVYPTRDCELPHPCAFLLHAALLDMIRAEDPAMSDALHADTQAKQFAISTLWPRTRAQGDKLVIPKYTNCKFRVSAVGRPVFDAFSKAIFSRLAANSPISLLGREFLFVDAGMEPPHGGAATFEELLVDRGKSVEMRFVSPTTFRRRGVNVPLPDPALVYGSLWQKWQAFSDVRVEEGVYEEMSGALAVSAASIRTRMWKFPKFMLTGFAGGVLFELVRPVSCEARSLFNALSSMAFYTGVGYRTTMGMGQCRPAPE